ncbi:MAG: hypothetical protein ACKVP0_13380 [Pirellulaceae bacterium]
MKYSLRSLMILVLVLPPLLAGTWFGYQWLYPPFAGLPPALPPLNFSEEERREFRKLASEALFDPGGPPDPMPVSSARSRIPPND